jgi:ribosomal protein L14E/L6E/L27E
MCIWQVTKKASQKKIAKRSRLKAFTKVVNYNHIMPTRYTLDVDLKTVVTAEKLEATASRVEARKVSAINISYTIVILKIIHFHLRCLATGRII